MTGLRGALFDFDELLAGLAGRRTGLWLDSETARQARIAAALTDHVARLSR
jgi:hypothetical protein